MSDKRTVYNLVCKVKVATHGLTEPVDLEELLKHCSPLEIYFEGDDFSGMIRIRPKIIRIGLEFKESFA